MSPLKLNGYSTPSGLKPVDLPHQNSLSLYRILYFTETEGLKVGISLVNKVIL